MAKREFETSKAHAIRVETIDAKPLLDDLFSHSTLGFVSGNGRLGKTEIAYDADAGILQADLRINVDNITWSDRVVAHYFYLGQNGFGVKRRVEHYTQEFVEFVLANLNAIELARLPNKSVPSLTDTGISIRVPLDAQIARRIRGSLRILLVCRLATPFIQADTRFVEATINNPYEEKQISKGLVIKLLEVWLFDQATGTVYAKKVVDGCGPT